MKCFVCSKTVIPQGGYFKTQLFNGEHLCHITCKPVFFYQKDADTPQQELFDESPKNTTQPSDSRGIDS